MDYKTARNFLGEQGRSLETGTKHDAFLVRLQKGQPPIPGQATYILLALKMAFEGLQDQPMLDREFALSLHLLAIQSLQLFDAGVKAGVIWPPMLKEDIERISQGVKSIFTGTWESN